MGEWSLPESELGDLLAYVDRHAEDAGLTREEAVASLLVAGITRVYGPGIWADRLLSASSPPAGLLCPLCGSPPMAVLGGGTQAFCPNPECKTLVWNPSASLEENLMNTHLVELREEGPGGLRGRARGRARRRQVSAAGPLIRLFPRRRGTRPVAMRASREPGRRAGDRRTSPQCAARGPWPRGLPRQPPR